MKHIPFSHICMFLLDRSADNIFFRGSESVRLSIDCGDPVSPFLIRSDGPFHFPFLFTAPSKRTMNTAQSFFLISIFLITALLALTVLLIVVTEQPDSMLEGRRRVVQSRAGISKDGGPFAQQTYEELKGADEQSTDDSSTPLSSSNNFDFELEKVAEFGPFNGGKFMGIQLIGHSLFLPKDDGRIEVRDARYLDPQRTINTGGIRIHRLTAVNEQIFVILDPNFERLTLFDAQNGSVLRERTLTRPVKELALDNAIVYTLSRSDTCIEAFELDELRPLKQLCIDIGTEEDDPRCDFIAVDNDDSLLISCGSSILRVSKQDGTVLSRFASPIGGNYSALLTIRSGHWLAVNKAKREMHLFSESTAGPIARLRHPANNGGVGRPIWIWTSLAFDHGNQSTLLFTLEYISNRVEVFRVPPNVLSLV